MPLSRGDRGDDARPGSMTEPVARAQPTPPFAAAAGTAWPAEPPPARPGPEWWGRRIGALPGVGRATVERAVALGLDTVGSLLEHLPARYESYDAARPVAELADGEE